MAGYIIISTIVTVKSDSRPFIHRRWRIATVTYLLTQQGNT